MELRVREAAQWETIQTKQKHNKLGTCAGRKGLGVVFDILKSTCDEYNDDSCTSQLSAVLAECIYDVAVR